MDPLRTPPAVAAFLAVIRVSNTDTAVKTVVCHSLGLWTPAYHSLRLTLGECHALPQEQPRPVARVAQTALALAQTMVDGIADTFRCVLRLPWTPVEVSHTHLTATFPHLCAAYRLVGDTDALSARMQAVHTRLCACRQAYRSPLRALSTSPATLHEVLTDLEQYTLAMLTFLAHNLLHGLRCPGARTEREPVPQTRLYELARSA
jgi:hypothetical protein